MIRFGEPNREKLASALQVTKPLRLWPLTFFSWRFSFNVFPDFLDALLRGDLSLMSASFVIRILLREVPGCSQQIAPGSEVGVQLPRAFNA